MPWAGVGLRGKWNEAGRGEEAAMRGKAMG